ncbi:hypothetical protein [Falsiroseomonas sp.]|uniref:hypothetical protein n=1 Tax=Falsiroseomonas sp. TaxID=2870721 RepID=UPI002716FAC8|nr:hypothetical protein [Falsiroseomonas sp.]MDO9501396.1 hypothetical protein [Falsiroseomonas sp.]
MAALTKDRDTPMMGEGGMMFVLPHGSAVTIYRGALVVVDSTGTVKPGTTATGLKAAGRAETGTTDDAALARFRRGVFLFENSASGEAITNAHYGDDVFIVDDQTVARTNGTGTRSVAGKCRGVHASGRVWVEI